ncbi:MAG: hypothetical protein IPM39_24760 [Chloroflexi bacterium]|nr:hypothetical protein [Chloroflexota bacterium]
MGENQRSLFVSWFLSSSPVHSTPILDKEIFNNKNTRTNHRPSFWVILALVGVLALTTASPSFAEDGTETGTTTITGAPLVLVATQALSFSGILNGTDQILAACRRTQDRYTD